MYGFQGARLETTQGMDVDLLGIRLSGHVRGLLFEAELEQRFRNSTKKNLELVYTFPLPWGAVLLAVEVRLGDQKLTGMVVEKHKAAAQYEEALSDGNAAIMLERTHDLSHCLNLGNLAPGEECHITLRYAQTLQFEHGSLRLMIPTSIAPRYGDDELDGGLLPHQVPEHGLEQEYAFGLQIILHGNLTRARVASPSHHLSLASVHSGSEEQLHIGLARQAWLDRDFVLALDRLEQASLAIAAQDPMQQGGLAFLASFCPAYINEQPGPLNAKILVDCSGSMAGDSLEAARRALQTIVQGLADGEHFSLSRFGSGVEHRSRGLWKATAVTRRSAEQWVAGLRADMGGTDMEAALTSTFALGQDQTKVGQSDILLITDGEISAIDQTIASARTSGHRIFIVGIGSSPAETHLRRLAEATGGICDFVSPGESVEPAVLRMFSRLRLGRLSNLRLEWPEGTEPTWASPLPAFAFNGDTINAFAFFDQLPAGQVRLLASSADDAGPIGIGSADLPVSIDPSDSLARMAAAARIEAMERLEISDPAADSLGLALDYQLITSRTNFLLLHERAEAEKAKEMPELRKVRQMLPAGWGGLGSVRAEEPQGRCLSGGMQNYEIPMFSRRAGAPLRFSLGDVTQGYEMPLLSPSALDTSPSGELGPLELHEFLRSRPKSSWPRSYGGLLRLGLAHELVDWLRLELAHLDGIAHDQRILIATFLHLMASAEMARYLMQEDRDLRIQLKIPAVRNLPEALLNSLIQRLGDCTASHWPPSVVAVDA